MAESKEDYAKKSITAMRLMVLWEESHYFCLTREGECKTCPYYNKGICTKLSTEEVMEHCASTFKDFLEG